MDRLRRRAPAVAAAALAAAVLVVGAAGARAQDDLLSAAAGATQRAGTALLLRDGCTGPSALDCARRDAELGQRLRELKAALAPFEGERIADVCRRVSETPAAGGLPAYVSSRTCERLARLALGPSAGDQVRLQTAGR
jgi:hypothetical protein